MRCLLYKINNYSEFFRGFMAKISLDIALFFGYYNIVDD